MSRRSFLVICLLILAAGGVMRGVWLRADPPVINSVGIVWHDEGAWVHNARNKALDGTWRTDQWNPMFIAPVFTALEYGSFRAFGVGLWQARMVPLVSGLVAVAALMWGLSGFAGRRAAVAGGVLLATNYAFVMWNRAALMESTMTAFIVVGWAAYARAERRPGWAVIAGAAAVLAWFTKASAAFFIAALALDALVAILFHPTRRRAGLCAIAGLAGLAAVIAAVFVVPHWTEYQFYNWQMTVTRKPDYGLSELIYRATGLPVAQGLLSRMWLVVLWGAVAIVSLVPRWRTARPGERLLALWVLVGIAELVAYDSTNERRYVMFIPALVALTALILERATTAECPAEAEAVAAPRMPAERLVGPALVLVLGYIVTGSLLRLAFLQEGPHPYSLTVRLSAAFAAGLAAVAWWQWPALREKLLRPRLPALLAALVIITAVVFNLSEYSIWAATRTTRNYDASVALGRLLPPGTLVQGKLANGLSLDNRIRPLFIGNGFGNYADRLTRDDARYILTYDLPRIGYESSDGSGLIQELLDHYPNRRVIATLDVEETSAADRAVLVAK